MRGHGRQLYEVRVRIQTGPDKWTKKSKFYNARNPGDAREKYHGKGSIMSVESVKQERLLGGIGEFFKLGDSLLKELQDAPEGGELQLKIKRRRNFFENSKRHALEGH